jgi:hypothetical protein
MRFRLLIGSLLFLTLLPLLIAPSPGKTADFSVIALIDDAYYCCLEDDGAENDIVYEMSVYLPHFKLSYRWIGYELEIFVGLEKPSGAETWYKVTLIAYTDFFFMDFLWYNYATESGVYTAHCVGIGSDQGANDWVIYQQLEFDPPGGGIKGASPDAAVIIY